MKKKLQRLLQLSLSPGARRKTQFNGPLLDQKREDVFRHNAPDRVHPLRQVRAIEGGPDA